MLALLRAAKSADIAFTAACFPDVEAAAQSSGRSSSDRPRPATAEKELMETTPCTVDLPTFPVDYVEMLTKANSRKVLYALHLT